MQRIEGFYRLSLQERKKIVNALLSKSNNQNERLDETIADSMIENYFQNYELPMGLTTNFQINGQYYHIPMVTEEPSVIAAASNGAKRLGNIITESEPRELMGQIVLHKIKKLSIAEQIVNLQKQSLLEKAKELSKSMVKRGGGPTRIWTEIKETFLTVYIGFNPCDALGANILNHVLESMSDELEQMTNAKALMRILSNYQPDSIVKAEVSVSIATLEKDKDEAMLLAKNIELASHYAELDVYRATTHNKGIMNGIDAVVLATGNDSRATNVGVHAYAAKEGKYQPLTKWWVEGELLKGKIELPLAVATVGGTISVHPLAKQSLQLLGNPDAKELSEIMAAVGLAQNFAALRAIVSEGIQKGHMGLHARQLAIQVGAGEDETKQLVELLKRQPVMSATIAKELLSDLRKIK